MEYPLEYGSLRMFRKAEQHKRKFPTFNLEQFLEWWFALSMTNKKKWLTLPIEDLNKKRKKQKNFINWANSQK